jgi:transketolase
VEILCSLFYGGIIRHLPRDPLGEGRDRFIISKGHGSISFYPILADLGYFDARELERTGQPGALLKNIPDTFIPGYEAITGSMGLGLGVACGIAVALRERKLPHRVIVLSGDGELNEGSFWEAIMFAAHHRLSRLLLIVDRNRKSMMGCCRDIIDLDPLGKKFQAFGWETAEVDGHSLRELHAVFTRWKESPGAAPRVIIANTVKGKGIPQLENDPLCHIRELAPEVLDAILKERR